MYWLLVFRAIHVSRNKHGTDVAETHTRYFSACLDFFLSLILYALDSSIYVSKNFFSRALEHGYKVKILSNVSGTEKSAKVT